MSKLLTVYDNEEPLNNVICALTMEVDEVFYIYHHEVEDQIFKNINKVLTRHLDIKTNFIKLYDDEKEIIDILDNNKNLIVDVGGAKYLSLLLFDLVKERDNKVIYFDDEENVIKDYRSHSIITKKIYKLSIEDILNLKQGEIVESMHRAVNDDRTISTINKIVENNLDNYESFIRYLTKINSMINKARKFGERTFKLSEKQIREICTDACYKKRNGLFEIEEDKIIFKTTKLRKLVGVSGAFLENYLYHKLINSKKFDDVRMSAVVDFSDQKYPYVVRCEIDLLAVKNNKLLFISCKSNKIDTTDLNEIYVHNSMFGNVLSIPVICLCENADRKFPSIYSKAVELGVCVVDKSNMQEDDFPEVFNRIVEGIYVYDDLVL